MSLLGIALIVIGVFLAIKLVGFALRIGMVLLVLFGLYLVLGPLLGPRSALPHCRTAALPHRGARRGSASG